MAQTCYHVVCKGAGAAFHAGHHSRASPWCSCPAVSTFIISRMLGGGSNLLIGDLIELQFLGNSYNYNLGSAMSLVLMVIVLLCMSFTTADTEEMEAMV